MDGLHMQLDNWEPVALQELARAYGEDPPTLAWRRLGERIRLYCDPIYDPPPERLHPSDTGASGDRIEVRLARLFDG